MRVREVLGGPYHSDIVSVVTKKKGEALGVFV